MTSNIGARLITENIKLGFGDNKSNEDNKKIVMSELKKEFKPEFINRIDEIIVFNKLREEDIVKIIDIMILQLQERLKEKNIKIEVTEEFKKYISNKEIDINYGARQLRRKLQNIIENKIAEEIIRCALQQGQKITFDVKENEIKVDIE